MPDTVKLTITTTWEATDEVEVSREEWEAMQQQSGVMLPDATWPDQVDAAGASLVDWDYHEKS